MVGYSTYYRHHNKHFDLNTQQWITSTAAADDVVEDTDCIVETTEEDECDTYRAVYESMYLVICLKMYVGFAGTCYPIITKKLWIFITSFCLLIIIDCLLRTPLYVLGTIPCHYR